MGELTPIDPTNLNEREIGMAALNGVQQVHACLEEHIRMWREHAAQSTEKRQLLAEDLLVAKGVALDTRAEVRDIALALKIRAPDPGEQKPRTNVAASWGPLKVIAAVGAGVTGAIGGAAALYQLFHAIWPSVSAFLLSYHK